MAVPVRERVVEIEADLGEQAAPRWRYGSGLVVGGRTVLTAAHAVVGAEAVNVRGPNKKPYAAAIDPAWIGDPDHLDLALLEVPDLPHELPFLPIALVDRDVESGQFVEDCWSVGYPEFQEVERSEEGSSIRETAEVEGRIPPLSDLVEHLLSFQVTAKPRELPARGEPLDLSEWSGMSGAAVFARDALIGIVAEHAPRRGSSDITVTPFDALSRADCAPENPSEWWRRLGVSDSSALRRVPERPPPPGSELFATALIDGSLSADGLPLVIGEFDDLSVFGVKPAGLPGEPAYLDYVPRDEDAELRAALTQAIDTRRMLLVVGASASGKSRSAAEAVIEVLDGHRLLIPIPGMLHAFRTAPLALLAPAVVWLDDLEVHIDQGFADTIRRLLNAGLQVVSTIRRVQLDRLSPVGDIQNPIGTALHDERLIRRIDWKRDWSSDERSRLRAHTTFAPLLEAVNQGIPPGVYCVAGTELVRRLSDARSDDENCSRFALVRTVLDWHRTGMIRPIALADARSLMSAYLGTSPPDDDDFRDALEFGTASVLGANRKTRQALLTLTHTVQSLVVHEYVRDYDDSTTTSVIPDVVWRAVLKLADHRERRLIGFTAATRQRIDISTDALTPLAEGGDPDATYGLGLILETTDGAAARRWFLRGALANDPRAMNRVALLIRETNPVEAERWWTTAALAGEPAAMHNLGNFFENRDRAKAIHWYEQAAKAGHTGSMNNLGWLIRDTEPDAARAWLTQAAEAGNAKAMTHLGLLLASDDPASAAQWFERAAATGHSDAMYQLGLLLRSTDPDAARGWLQRAATAGHVEAALTLETSECATRPSTAFREELHEVFTEVREWGDSAGGNRPVRSFGRSDRSRSPRYQR